MGVEISGGIKAGGPLLEEHKSLEAMGIVAVI